MSDFAPWWMLDDVEPSFRIPLDDPGVAPDASPTVCIPLNQSWQAIMAGCALQVALPASWNYADEDQLNRLMGYATTLINLIGFAVNCVNPTLRFEDCTLQLSLDGGATWTAVAGWVDGFGACVRGNQALVIMAPGVSSPPVPVWTPDGTDWVYTP